MNNINLKSTNRKASIGATLFLIMYGVISFVIPLIFINLIPQSSIGYFFVENIFILMVFYLLISFYFIITGFYYYYIKIDAYIMYITSYRTITGLFKVKNYIEVPHNMLIGYSFFNRYFSLNKTLMIKIQNDTGKRIIKRFNISFLSKSEELKIGKILEEIIAKNS